MISKNELQNGHDLKILNCLLGNQSLTNPSLRKNVNQGRKDNAKTCGATPGCQVKFAQ